MGFSYFPRVPFSIQGYSFHCNVLGGTRLGTKSDVVERDRMVRPQTNDIVCVCVCLGWVGGGWHAKRADDVPCYYINI